VGWVCGLRRGLGGLVVEVLCGFDFDRRLKVFVDGITGDESLTEGFEILR
jgi:hypothetical protein